MDKATQKAKILAYCVKHGSITVREAFQLDINSPTKRISEMKKAGYEVRIETEVRIKPGGKTVRYNRYFINAPKGVVS